MLHFKYTEDVHSSIYEDSLLIRQSVFISEQHVNPAIEIDDKEKDCVHLVAYNQQEKAVATARLFSLSPSSFKIQRVAVVKELRGKKYGNAIMKKIEEIAKEKHIKKLVLGAQNYAIPFYEKLGYSPEGEEYEEAGILHRHMKKNI